MYNIYILNVRYINLIRLRKYLNIYMIINLRYLCNEYIPIDQYLRCITSGTYVSPKSGMYVGMYE